MRETSSHHFLSRKLIALLAFAVGVIAANLYYAQPLTAQIAHSLGLQISIAGLIVTLIQVGYGMGVLFLVPLADLFENRRLILSMVALAVVALIGVATSNQVIPYFISAFFLGVGASAVQIIVPYAAHLSPEHKRGQVVGNLMSGLMMGIMLSRPIASLLTDLISWHAVFYLSAIFMSIMATFLYFKLPTRKPNSKNIHYLELLASMSKLLVTYSVLRRRAFYQACMFCAFCIFWTATPLVLAGPAFHLSQTEIAIFALVGVAGAILAPIAGKLADRGWTKTATFIGMSAGGLAFLITHLANLGSIASLVLLTIGAVLLDAGVTANLVMGQREIFSLPSELRARLNSIYIAIIFIGGSFGSFIGAWAYAHGNWNLTSWIGFAFPTIGLIVFATESTAKVEQ
jgi:predicted MFS family arabinose efflux permease